jgi:hypothetical protein
MSEIPKTVSIKAGTEHELQQVPRWLYLVGFYLVKILMLGIGIYITIAILYKECLNSSTVNSIVVSYFCLLASACFLSLGLPIEKLGNISVSGGK